LHVGTCPLGGVTADRSMPTIVFNDGILSSLCSRVGGSEILLGDVMRV